MVDLNFKLLKVVQQRA